MKRLTLEEAKNMTVLSQGHFDNLIYEENNIRIWLSRMTIADGIPYDNQITVEEYCDGVWATLDVYQAK